MPVSAMRRHPVAAIAISAVLVGVVYAVAVPAGLPYDEPSHWANVAFLMDHGRLYDLRSVGVSYEAQQGPLAYLAYAAPAGLARTIGLSPGSVFTVSRVVGLALLAALVVVIHGLLRQVVPTRPGTALVATSVVCLNPMVVAMAASIQNDVLALVLAVVAMGMAAHPTTLNQRQAVLLGVVSGAALLTKITVAPALLVVGVVLVIRHTPAPRLMAALAAAAAVSGWWFARNYVLYGDVTGMAGVRALGFSFVSAPVRGLVGVKNIAAEIVTYLWVPTEYFRNVIDLPPAVRGLLALLTVVLVGRGVWCAIAALKRGQPNSAAWITGGTAVVALIAWFGTRVTLQGVSVRTAFVALPAWGLLAGAALLTPGKSLVPRLATFAFFMMALHIVILALTISTRLSQPLLVP